MLLQGKTALIIGGSRGIGKAVAEEFLKEGAKVCIASRDTKTCIQIFNELSKQHKNTAQNLALIIAKCDIAYMESVRMTCRFFQICFGHIDILVNAAGIHGEIGQFAKGDSNQWEEAIKVNLFGTANAMRAVLPQMIEHGKGKIINFSGGGATSPRPYFSSYAVSKTAVVKLTETVAEEMRELGVAIDINAIAPGAINTRLLDEVLSAGPEKSGQKEYELALKRKADGGEDPKKAAALAVFLASNLSDGLTGRLISAVWDKWRDIPGHLKEIADSDIFTLRRVTPKERGYGW